MTVTARVSSTSPAVRPLAGPRLSVVRSPEPARSAGPFFLLCGAILLLSLVIALVLNTAMAVSSYRVHDQRVVLTQMQEEYHDLDARLDSLGSPSVLRDQALEMGMVPAGATLYLSVGDQEILGTAASGVDE